VIDPEQLRCFSLIVRDWQKAAERDGLHGLADALAEAAESCESWSRGLALSVRVQRAEATTASSTAVGSSRSPA
jgi:hypothetical protein